MPQRTISILNKNQLPKFMEEFIGAAAKTIDALDLSKDDGWLSSIPFGKLAGFAATKIIEISKEGRALSHAVGFACGATFSKSILRNALDPKVPNEAYERFEGKLKALLKKKDVNIAAFNVAEFWESSLAQEYITLFEDLIGQSDTTEQQWIRIKNYLKDYCELQFRHILREDPAVYAKLITYLNDPAYDAETQLFKLEKYRAGLKNQYTELTLNDTQGMTLDYIYQKPNFSFFSKCLSKERRKELGNDAYISSQDIGVEENVHTFVLEWLKGRLSNEALDSHHSQILLLYGFPGQGKTSFCKRVVHDVMGLHPIDQPVYMVRFRNIAEPQELKAEVLGTIRNHLGDRYGLSISKGDLSSSLLILDGLDELLMKNDLKTSDVDDIMKSLGYAAKLNSNLRILVTSRHGYLNHQYLTTNSLLVLSLDEFTKEQQLIWLKAFRKFHPESWLTLKKFEEIHRGSNYLQELLAQPILLHMVASLEEEVVTSVGNRATVYDLLFKQITEPKKWKKSQIDVLEGLDQEDLRRALREIAFHIFISGKEYIHKSKIETLPEVKRLKNSLEGRGGSFREALKVMMVAFYFQEIPKEKEDTEEDDYDYGIEFLHKSLQEYLTAEYIYNTLLDELLGTDSRRGNYNLNDDSQVLELLQAIFGHQPMSIEVANYLVEIIQNDKSVEDKQELSERLESVFDYALQKQFVYSFDANQQDSVMDFSNWIFHGYWTVFAHLKEKIDLFGEGQEERQRHFISILRFFKYNKTVLKPLRLAGIDLQYANLRGADLRGVDLHDAHLLGADLCGAQLIDADLSGADLRGVRFRGAAISIPLLRGTDVRRSALLRETDLRRSTSLRDTSHRRFRPIITNLNGANLNGAILGNADLSGVCLSDLDLRGADLRDVNLRSADLSGTDLSSTDFHRANLRDANLRDANLCSAKNLTSKQLASAHTIEEVKGVSSAFLEEVERIRGGEE